MNDETHDSGQGIQAAGTVLRPFTPPEVPPLPPIEPSRVVPAPPPVEEPPTLAEEPPSDPPIPPPPPVEALADDPWAPDGADANAEFDDSAAATEPETEPGPPVDETQAGETQADETLAHEDLAHEDLAVDEAAVEETGDEVAADETVAEEPVLEEFVAEEFVGDEPAAPDAAAGHLPADTVTLPRKPFLVGLAVLLAAVAVFAVLWQTGDDASSQSVTGDDATEEIVADDPVDTTAVDADPLPSDVDVPDDGVAAGLVDDLTTDLAEASAEIAGLEAVVATLEDRPPPALDGSKLRRIVVGADAKFVSALPESVAVVGAFGGVSLIDPATNRVVATGNVADAATRVLRTPTSVWMTNYADSQILRVDPATNTVAARFAFPGPDGIAKDGDTLLIASFDGGFVSRINPGDGATIGSVDVGGKPTDVLSHVNHGIWAAIFDTGEIVQIDPATFEIVRRVTVGQGPVGISADPSFLWVSNHDEGTIAKVDPQSGEVLFAVAVGAGPTESTVGAGSVWVTVTDDGALVELAPEDGEIRSITPLGGAAAGGGPTGITFADGTLWIAMQGEQSVVRIDLG